MGACVASTSCLDARRGRADSEKRRGCAALDVPPERLGDDFFAQLGGGNSLSRTLLLQFDGVSSVHSLTADLRGGMASRSGDDEQKSAAAKVFGSVLELSLPPPDVVPEKGARLYISCRAPEDEAHVSYANAQRKSSLHHSTQVKGHD